MRCELTSQAPRIQLNGPQPAGRSASEEDLTTPGVDEGSDAEGEEEISETEDVPMVSSLLAPHLKDAELPGIGPDLARFLRI